MIEEMKPVNENPMNMPKVPPTEPSDHTHCVINEIFIEDWTFII